MNNRPGRREKHVTGQGKDIGRRGSGLGTGPVGRSDGYGGRKTSSSGGSSAQRSGGIGGLSPITIIIIVALLVFGGGGLGFGNLLFGGDTSDSGASGYSQSVGGLSGLGNSMFSGGNSTSSGWVTSKNTGKFDTSVASGSREKYTNIVGGGADTVTIMLYMCGTDLESKSGMATSDLQEMAKASISDNVNLIVYTGGCSKWNNNIISNKVNQIYKVENGGLRCLVKDDGNASLTKSETLTGFIKYCKDNYEADRYDLIFWDHGGGTISGYGYDEKHSSSGSMTLSDIDKALKNAGTKFDFIGFDACLMATLENALMLDSYADYLIASEETEPGVGWYYTDWLTKLSANTSMPTAEIGKNIVDDFVAVCNRTCSGQKTTLSVVDLAELSNTVPENLKSFASSTSELLQSGGYKTVSDARSSAREFARESKIDQVDLVNLAYNIGGDEAEDLAACVLGAIKYNRTSSNMTNAYGLSIYFPYKKTSSVNSAVAAYNAIGIDDEYTRCIQQFASLEVGGQASSGASSNPLSTLLGASYSGTSSSSDIANILSGLLGAGTSSYGLTAGNSGFFPQQFDVDRAAEFISANQFDASKLKWDVYGNKIAMDLDEEQWSLVHDLQLNVFFDDGEGFIDLGLDNVYDLTEEGFLLGEYDGTWLAIDDQPIAYYFIDMTYEGGAYTITGRVPVLLNDDRAELLITFDTANPYGYISGARYFYADGETDTVAKGITELSEGDYIQFIADYYSYDGSYEDTYVIGSMTYTGDHEISNVYIDGKAAVATYMFTDIYNNEFWTPEIP